MWKVQIDSTEYWRLEVFVNEEGNAAGFLLTYRVSAKKDEALGRKYAEWDCETMEDVRMRINVLKEQVKMGRVFKL